MDWLIWAFLFSWKAWGLSLYPQFSGISHDLYWCRYFWNFTQRLSGWIFLNLCWSVLRRPFGISNTPLFSLRNVLTSIYCCVSAPSTFPHCTPFLGLSLEGAPLESSLSLLTLLLRFFMSLISCSVTWKIFLKVPSSPWLNF